MDIGDGFYGVKSIKFIISSREPFGERAIAWVVLVWHLMVDWNLAA